ncbi:hypothetical protein MLD38_001141 [Melastoma candidum]|uniref:Uncharacterized protein n=1 Tax=Melastoma candidum TaxID=119954 RepID=A0ACB9SH69_9MYRT|nr:hypothetical protein MLD38_001141 [Melastoma candidum]
MVLRLREIASGFRPNDNEAVRKKMAGTYPVTCVFKDVHLDRFAFFGGHLLRCADPLDVFQRPSLQAPLCLKEVCVDPLGPGTSFTIFLGFFTNVEAG